MTKAYVVVEGPTDAQILRALLGDKTLQDVKFLNGEGKYGAEIMARSLLLDKHIPVLLIIDADTNDLDAIHSYQQDLEFLTRRAAVGTPYKIVQAIPTIESVFLWDRSIFEQCIDHKFSDLEWELGQENPKKLLAQYSGGAKAFIQQTLDNLSEDARKTWSKHPVIQETLAFLDSPLTGNHAEVALTSFYVHTASEECLSEVVDFKFVDGGSGTMSRGEMVLHVVNHGTYHRGFVSDMMYQVPAVPPANDLTVYLRDVVYQLA